MKKFIFLFLMMFATGSFAQNVILSKVEKSHSNSNKIFYKINPEMGAAEYLGELEVQGFSGNDAEVFGKVYKKAKEIGANAFSWNPFESVDGASQKFDPVHYRLNLYYVAPDDLPKEDNVIYLISSPVKKQTISIDGKKTDFEPRTFRKLNLDSAGITTISTRKLLGSTIKVSAQQNQPVQYFQLSAFSVNNNPYGTAGINLKSGDIIKLEQSFGQFLTTIYQSAE
ncbi:MULTISPECIES: hypothetical protein [Chryseobacterium]|uniref:hypothetical protein n=1 Tax=Chryseobacterium sp. R2A-55 TaxID=2744445 RepID=UPI001F29AFE5|nr:hypothetical protein [Chryseobacterium sp. R2A-55]